jgi:hypothetical protein
MKSLSFRAARFRGQNPESVPFDTMSKSLGSGSRLRRVRNDDRLLGFPDSRFPIPDSRFPIPDSR